MSFKTIMKAFHCFYFFWAFIGLPMFVGIYGNLDVKKIILKFFLHLSEFNNMLRFPNNNAVRNSK